MTAVRSLAARPATRALAVLVVLAALPYSAVTIPGVFDGPFDSAGVLQLLALCLVFAGLALGYDLLFGRTGLLSFGHGLFVTVGVYATTILVDQAGLGLLPAVLAGLGVGTVLAAVLGGVALRVSGLGFAMVTLAFAQAASILVTSDPHGLTGGEQGRGLDAGAVPAALSGVVNTVHLYWLALGYAAVCAVVVWWSYASIPGQVWRGIRDNERRVEVLGLNPYPFKLLAFVIAGALATGGGIVYLLLEGGASPEVSTSNFTLALLVMVVLGGSGSRWGPIVGGMLYVYARQTLTRISGSSGVAGLPGVLRGPLEQPLFILGTLFVLVVFFAPGGVTRLTGRIRPQQRGMAMTVTGQQPRRTEFRVAVPGGELAVVRWPALRPATAPTVVALHGITANALAWGEVADALAGRVTLLAPDLRGRAGSRGITGPWGVRHDADDVIAVLDAAGLDRALLVGHSLGAFVACVAAARHPDRVSGVLAVDGGLGFPVPDGTDPDRALGAVIGPALDRLSMTFASPEAYRDFWRAHPALAGAWTPRVAAYIDRDLVGAAPRLVSSCSREAVTTDGREVLLDPEVRDAIRTLRCRVVLLTAERGLLDQPRGLYDDARLAAARLGPERVTTAPVPGTNHYTVLITAAGTVAEHIVEF